MRTTMELNMAITETKQRHLQTILFFVTPHDVGGAERALREAGYGTKLRLELVDDGDFRTRYLQVWQATDFAGDYNSSAAMAVIDTFWKQVAQIVGPFGGDIHEAGFSDTEDPSIIPPDIAEALYGKPRPKPQLYVVPRTPQQ
jgi:hypothetical protein